MGTFRLLLVFCLCALLGQAAGKPAAPPAKAVAGPRLTDAQLQQMILAKYNKSKIHADGFTFKVQSGVVTIEGKTSVVQHKGAATRMARTAGAVAVVNNIQISDAAKQKLAQQLAKGKAAAVVKP